MLDCHRDDLQQVYHREEEMMRDQVFAYLIAALFIAIGLFAMLLSSPRVFLRLTLSNFLEFALLALIAIMFWAGWVAAP